MGRHPGGVLALCSSADKNGGAALCLLLSQAQNAVPSVSTGFAQAFGQVSWSWHCPQGPASAWPPGEDRTDTPPHVLGGQTMISSKERGARLGSARQTPGGGGPRQCVTADCRKGGRWKRDGAPRPATEPLLALQPNLSQVSLLGLNSLTFDTVFIQLFSPQLISISLY